MAKMDIAKQLNKEVLSVIGSEKMNGFEKAYLIADAIGKLKTMLTPEYMKPIMELQGNRLGFRTDKDKSGGYPVDVVRNCLIEAVLMGLQPTGNQFNIIAGNCYPTKEGCGYLLNHFKGLKFNIVCSLPRTSANSAAVDATISWSINGRDEEKTIPIAIKTDAYTSVDAINGKATRKARAWLLSTLTGTEITDGEVEDGKAVTVESTIADKKNNMKNDANGKLELM